MLLSQLYYYPLFHGDIGIALGLKIESGAKSPISGVVQGAQTYAYFHHVNLWVGVDMIKIITGFVPDMAVGALLGRHGFFEHF